MAEAVTMKRNGFLLVLFTLLATTALAKASGKGIYDEKTDARRQVASAIAEASRSGKNVVLIFGANW